eukprot:TRINITY_DN51_c0_g3_i4.p1 TRINITY_DN51_c0_g3~~TRINITY_DN51_c0_g3_i4.p1  ORF type:complete len:750 (-),score=182.80 TRINITY_DN51_c0_g3_i4:1805-4054(-)
MWKNLTDTVKQKTGLGQTSERSSSSKKPLRTLTTSYSNQPVSPSTTPSNARANASPSPLSSDTSQTSGPFISEEDWTNLEIEEEQYVPAVELQDVLEDSPMLREKLHLLGQNADAMAAKLKKIVKVSRAYQESCKEMGQATELFGRQLLSFNTGAGSLQDPTLDEGLKRFGVTFGECNEQFSLLAMQMESVFSTPIDTFIREDIREVKDEAKRYEKARSVYDGSVQKVSQLKKKDGAKIAEVEHELDMAKQQFNLEGLEFVYKMNELQLKKKIEFLERICAFMFGQLGFFHSGYQMFQELEPYMRGLTVRLQQARAQFEEQKQNLQHQKKALIKYASGPRQAKVTEDSLEIAGYLFKKGHNVLKEWERCYFVIKDGFLHFYKNGKDTTPTKSESLLLFTVKPVDDPDRRFCFDIVSPNKTYSLQASCQAEMMEWIKVMQNATAALLNLQLASNKGETASSPSSKSAASHTASPLTQLQEADENNRLCADCGARDPPWAVINWGFLICLECSGVHRSLGVQVSRVRSLTLDALDPESLKLMLSIGNTKSNAIFEAKVPPGTERLNPKSPRDARERFIKAKYVQKQFVEPTSMNKAALDLSLWHSSWEDNVIAMAKLVAQGADVNYKSESEEKTPLHATAIEGNLVCMEFLIQSGALVNVVDSWSWAPLHYAALHGKTHCAILLVKRNADTTIKDRDGNTPLNIAIMNQQADCVTLLRLTQLSLQENPQERDATSFANALKEFSKSLPPQM